MNEGNDAYIRSQTIDAIIWMTGCTKKEAAERLRKLNLEQKMLYVDVYNSHLKKAFYED